uniref:sestrin-3 isoform X2 n=1 Tax=Ciona intestinalis TaxID=7719 RepID=UPI00006A3692|nr:sestrin-3 isoform X2 [Ciona intestinalis]|eukprot:XP_002129228.1 sestrin-3 isoform X2 [Ciona intestinalis]
MDQNATSLSLALEKHELSCIPTPHYNINGITPSESSSCRVDATSQSSPSGDWLGSRRSSNFSYSSERDVFDDYALESPEELTYDAAQRLFEQLSNKDESIRKLGLNNLTRSIFIWVKSDFPQLDSNDNSPRQRLGSASDRRGWDKTPLSRQGSSESAPATVPNSPHSEPARIVQQALASLLRLSIRCPFSDVRDRCSEILRDLKDKNVVVPTPVRVDVSRFIPRDEIHPIDTDDEQAHSLYSESFIQNCRLEHMVMVMGLHPQYLQQFLDTNVHLLQSSGALSYEYRSYIAIMAAARHQCTYLVHLMEAQFLLQGGNREWLKGLDHIPAKLRALSKLNRLLAHRPWLVTAQDFKDLTEGDAASRWQHSQLAQAVVLLCHFHGLAIFCHGTGVNLELDHSKAHSFHTRSGSPTTPRSKPTSGSNTPVDFRQGRKSPPPQIEQIGDVEVLMERMRKLQEEEEDVTTEERNRRFEIEKEEASYSLIPGASGPVGGAAYFARYVEDPQFSYQDFAKRDAHAEIPTFRAQDYNWDHAFTVMTGYYGEVAELLDEKYKTAYNLTYKTLATRDNVDTTSLRRAIWMYVHCMYGIMYDDYNYSEVNQLLERPLKVFIKTVSCFPEKTTQAVYDGFWKQFRHSEKVHVNIMLLEARMQVGLLYGLRALTQCMRES